VTLNTDFAQVEADDQQVNLDRFSLFFPEKRPFFLENAGLFRVAAGAPAAAGWNSSSADGSAWPPASPYPSSAVSGYPARPEE